jgi:hypothetical protein
VDDSSGSWSKVSKLKAFSWKRLCHAQVGGITDGSFWVRCNKERCLAPTLDPNFCSLKDILSLVQLGLSVRPPPLNLIYHQKEEPKVLMNDGLVGHSSLLPYGKADTKVYALSAFGRGPAG